MSLTRQDKTRHDKTRQVKQGKAKQGKAIKAKRRGDDKRRDETNSNLCAHDWIEGLCAYGVSERVHGTSCAYDIVLWASMV